MSIAHYLCAHTVWATSHTNAPDSSVYAILWMPKSLIQEKQPLQGRAMPGTYSLLRSNGRLMRATITVALCNKLTSWRRMKLWMALVSACQNSASEFLPHLARKV